MAAQASLAWNIENPSPSLLGQLTKTTTTVNKFQIPSKFFQWHAQTNSIISSKWWIWSFVCFRYIALYYGYPLKPCWIPKTSQAEGSTICRMKYWQKTPFHCTFIYRVSLKKRYFLGFRLISVLEVGFNLIMCVSESEFWALYIKPLKQ